MDALGGDITQKAVNPFFRKVLRVNRHCQHVIYSVGPVHEHMLGVFVLGGSSARRFHTTNKLNLDNMKALHIHGEVIPCSEDVSTVGAVTNVGLS